MDFVNFSLVDTIQRVAFLFLGGSNSKSSLAKLAVKHTT